MPKILVNFSFFKIINEDFKYSILINLKQPNDNLVVREGTLQDGS